MSIAQLYERDTAEWARQNAELLRAGRFSEADIEHIAEEIEDLGKRERQILHSRLTRLMEHLLKWQYQPDRRGLPALVRAHLDQLLGVLERLRRQLLT